MDLDLQNEELDQHLVGLCDWFTFITNIPSLVVEQQKIVHFGYGLLFTEVLIYEIERRALATDA